MRRKLANSLSLRTRQISRAAEANAKSEMKIILKCKIELEKRKEQLHSVSNMNLLVQKFNFHDFINFDFLRQNSMIP